MIWSVMLVVFSVVALIATGIYLELNRGRVKLSRTWFKPVLGANLTLFGAGILITLVLGVDQVLAAEATTATAPVDMVGLGLALIGIGLPTGLATIAAGIAVGPVGAAALAVIAEKPEMFGRTLIYLGLAEGIAIYGLVVTILLLGKI
ncbi:MAG: ATP synthase subunit C [bacterium]